MAVTARTEAEWDPRLPGTIHDTVNRIEAAGGRAVAVAADLATPADVERLVAEARSALGPIDVLVNNTAVTVPGRPPTTATGAPPAPATRSATAAGAAASGAAPRRCRTTWPSDASRSKGSGCTSRWGCSPPTA